MRLDHYASDAYSQFGEDGMIAKIFSLIGEGGRVCVEFGAADGSSCSNTARLWRNEWTALLIEGDPTCYDALTKEVAGWDNVHTANIYLTPTGDDSIDNILVKRALPKVDFMSIDVDGIDYQIWDEMTVVRPRVICIEYNQSIPPHVSLHQRDLDDCLGASAKALVDLGKSKGYLLVGMNKANLFFVVVEESSLFFLNFACTLEEIFPYEGLSYVATDYHSHPFAVGSPPWGLHPAPYVGPTVGDPIHILGPITELIKVFEAEVGAPAVFIGQDWEVGPSARTRIGVAAYNRLFGSNHPLVILDVSNQGDIQGCRWVEAVANRWMYKLRIIRKDLFVFTKAEHPLVSIVILNYFHPEVIDVCLSTLAMTEGVLYEVVVVDNGSDASTVKELHRHEKEHRIDTLVLEQENHMFSQGNNIGVAHAHPESEYILLLNSDVGFLRPDWLSKMLEWMDGVIQVHPSVWGLKPTIPKEGPRDIVSIGWSHDATVLPGNVRPEGWCLLMRKKLWRDMSPDFPFLYGFEEMISGVIRDGAKCGVLCQYAKYLVHKEGGSGKGREVVSKRVPDIAGWFNGLEIESCDFTLGPDEHSSYMCW